MSILANRQRLAQSRHEPALWKEAFSRAGDGTSQPDMQVIRALRALIWSQTEKAIHCCLQRTPPFHNYPLHLTPRTQMYRLPSKANRPHGAQPIVEVEEMDVLVAAQRLTREGFKVAVLNMAAADCPGGGFRSGAGAQEENLHRRTDAYRFTEQQRRGNYPIPEDACLVSEDVTVLRGPESQGYPFLTHEDAFSVCLISCAALCYPRLTNKNEYREPGDRKLMETKVATIINAAAQANCTALILSAFGCGAFANPPEVVAQLFKKELESSPVRRVAFCICNDHNAGRSHNPRGNFLPFKEVFSQH